MIAREGFDKDCLVEVISEATLEAKDKLNEIKARKSAVSIGDMFDMQMLMNRLSQLSEMATSVISSAHTSIMSMARNIKG